MEIKYFCPLWGSEHLPFDTFLAKVTDEGYDGVEMSLPFGEHEKASILNSAKEFGLEIIAQHWETVDQSFTHHKTNFEKRLRNLAATNPLFINSQTGKDYYSEEQNGELIALADSIATDTGVKIVHETHRGKFSFAAHITERYINRHPALKLCLDISHWCCVAETFLEDQVEAVQAAIGRTHHLHARVGYTQGPQIMDPSAPENQPFLEEHLNWWQNVADQRRREGEIFLTITTEFGAPPYLPLAPRTQLPMYNQWDANVFMMQYLKSNLV